MVETFLGKIMFWFSEKLLLFVDFFLLGMQAH